MKNIEQILAEIGIELTDEQKTKINEAVKENYKTITDYNKQVSKLQTAETDRDAYKQQLDDANAKISEFADIDADKLKQEVADWKEKAEKAEADKAKELTARDQRDYLKAEFDKLGIKSERVRRSLSVDIMSEDGLKWKDGAFLGLADYLEKENQSDHFYDTEEDKAKKDAAGKVPNFTDPSTPKAEPSNDDPMPVIF